MSTLMIPQSSKSVLPRLRPARVRWTVEEFHELAGLPILENRKLILIDGEILDMPPANHPHDMGIGACQDTLATIFSRTAYWVRVQMALPLGIVTDPIPDLAVVNGARPTHTQQPSTALLVIEVSDSSLDFDTDDKANLYAAGGIRDYWVVDVNNRQLIVFRDPIADPTAVHGFRYQTQQSLASSATVNPLALPQAAIRVADLLP